MVPVLHSRSDFSSSSLLEAQNRFLVFFGGNFSQFFRAPRSTAASSTDADFPSFFPFLLSFGRSRGNLFSASIAKQPDPSTLDSKDRPEVLIEAGSHSLYGAIH